MAEVSLADLAGKRGSSDEVKQFASQMIEDHRQANSELRTVAGDLGIALPTGPGEKLDKPLAKLSKLEGKAFDRAYMEDMVKDHEEAMALFKSYADSGDNEQLRSFAKKKLPVLENHLKHARSIESGLSG